MTPGDGRVSNTVLKEGIEDIKELLINYEQRLRCLEQSYAGSQPLMLKSIADLKDKTDQHDKDLKALQDLITLQAQSIDKLAASQKSVSRILNWLLGIFTVVASAVILMLLTGQATLVFR